MLNDLRVIQTCIISRLDGQHMDTEVCHYQPTTALDIDGLNMLEQELNVMGNFNAAVSPTWLSFKLQASALKPCGARAACTTVRRMLCATIDELALHCSWLGTSEAPAISGHRFVTTIIGKLLW